jgi:hypothetical protein
MSMGFAVSERPFCDGIPNPLNWGTSVSL